MVASMYHRRDIICKISIGCAAPGRNAGVLAFVAAPPLELLYVSAVSFAEIRRTPRSASRFFSNWV
jgi:hypothetical protein